MGADITIRHMPELASWTVDARQLAWLVAGTSDWGTGRRHAGAQDDETFTHHAASACGWRA